MAYPSKPTGNNIIPEDTIFAQNNASKIVMSDTEILNGYNNDGDTETALTSRPDANRFNNFWYQMQNTLVWVIKYIEELYSDKLSKTGGTMTGYLNMGASKVTSSALPTQANDLTNKEYVDQAINANSMWIGEIKALAYPSVPPLPEGVEIVPCDGRAISRTTYSQLFSTLGTAFGDGDGSTTFNIPDYRGLFLRGWSGGSGRDSSRIYGQIQTSGSPNITGNCWITGNMTNSGISITGAFGSSGTYTGEHQDDWRMTIPKINFDASRCSAVYQNDLTEVRPVNSTCYYVIRIK